MIFSSTKNTVSVEKDLVIKCPIKNVNKANIRIWPFPLLARLNNIKNKKIHKHHSKN